MKEYILSALSAVAWTHLSSQLIIWTYESYLNQARRYDDAIRVHDFCEGRVSAGWNEFINCDHARLAVGTRNNPLSFWAHVGNDVTRKSASFLLETLDNSLVFVFYRCILFLLLAHGLLMAYFYAFPWVRLYLPSRHLYDVEIGKLE